MASTAAGIRAGKAYVEIGTKDSALTAGLRAAREKVMAFGKSIGDVGTKLAAAGAGIAAPLALAVKQFIDLGSQLDDMAKKTGFSVETLSELKFVADQSGSNLGDIEKAAKKMASTLIDAKNGSSSAADALAKLGLSAGTLLQLSPEDQFFAIAGALSKVEDATLKAALAQDIFGRAGTSLLPMLADGEDGIAALREEAKRLGITMSKEDAAAAEELGDAFGSLTAAAGSAFRQIGAELAPALKGIAADLTAILPTIREFIRDNGEWVATLAKIAAGLIAVGVAMKGLGATIGAVTAINPWILLAAAIAGVVAKLIEAKNAAEAFEAIGIRRFDPKGIANKAIRDAIEKRKQDRAASLSDATIDPAVLASLDAMAELVFNANAELQQSIDGYDDHTAAMIEAAEAAKRLRDSLDAEEQQRFDAMEQEARLQEIERDGHDAMIDQLEQQIEAARGLGERRAGLALAGSAEFAKALMEATAPRDDKQISLLQKQLEEEKRMRARLDQVVQNQRNMPAFGIIN